MQWGQELRWMNRCNHIITLSWESHEDHSLMIWSLIFQLKKTLLERVILMIGICRILQVSWGKSILIITDTVRGHWWVDKIIKTLRKTRALGSKSNILSNHLFTKSEIIIKQLVVSNVSKRDLALAFRKLTF